MKKYLQVILIIILLFLIFLFLSRLISPRQIDDVTPEIACENKYLEKAEILWIIPDFNNTLISENSSWCNYILNLNKTLGMHGVTHYYNEFKENLSKEYLENGVLEFEKCFNQIPTEFKPPKLQISKQNKILIKENNLKLKRYYNQLFHKVYHCNDSGTLPNWFHNLF